MAWTPCLLQCLQLYTGKRTYRLLKQMWIHLCSNMQPGLWILILFLQLTKPPCLLSAKLFPICNTSEDQCGESGILSWLLDRPMDNIDWWVFGVSRQRLRSMSFILADRITYWLLIGLFIATLNGVILKDYRLKKLWVWFPLVENSRGEGKKLCPLSVVGVKVVSLIWSHFTLMNGFSSDIRSTISAFTIFFNIFYSI